MYIQLVLVNGIFATLYLRLGKLNMFELNNLGVF